MLYRNLTDAETTALKMNGCSATQWSSVCVCDPFDAEQVRNVRFIGQVLLGESVELREVRRLENVEIGAGCSIVNVGTLAVEGETTFGNGVEIAPWNEGGGRAFPMYEHLTAQMAWILAVRRDRTDCFARLKGMIAQFATSKRNHRGIIGEKCRIENCNTIVNVAIGPGAQISGALELREGTIASRLNNPVRVGPGVIARHFILASGAELSDRTQVERCFIGQGTTLGKGFSAENCVFFANCEAFNGEAVAVFAGPYTVTHHKSTLLIAGLFSFFNAGSNANQSNHAYKLGPLHQGALLRGCKMASGAYICWPAVAGPFSVVAGKHYTHFDLADLPFSLIREHEGRTLVLPGMTLASSGTRRDVTKWPARDHRHPEGRLDQVHYDLFSPYVMGKVLRGLAHLEALKTRTPESETFAVFQDILIPRSALDVGIRHYRMFWDIFQGDCLSDLLERAGSWAETQKQIVELGTGNALPDWVDVAGMFAPAERIGVLLDDIATGRLLEEELVRTRLEGMAIAYPLEKLRWFAALLKNCTGIAPSEITAEQAENILTEWVEARTRWNYLVARDALKEFTDPMQVSYGLEGSAEIRKRDFGQIRGDHETNAFVQSLRYEATEIATRSAKLQALLKT